MPIIIDINIFIHFPFPQLFLTINQKIKFLEKNIILSLNLLDITIMLQLMKFLQQQPVKIPSVIIRVKQQRCKNIRLNKTTNIISNLKKNSKLNIIPKTDNTDLKSLFCGWKNPKFNHLN